MKKLILGIIALPFLAAAVVGLSFLYIFSILLEQYFNEEPRSKYT